MGVSTRMPRSMNSPLKSRSRTYVVKAAESPPRDVTPLLAPLDSTLPPTDRDRRVAQAVLRHVRRNGQA